VGYAETASGLIGYWIERWTGLLNAKNKGSRDTRFRICSCSGQQENQGEYVMGSKDKKKESKGKKPQPKPVPAGK